MTTFSIILLVTLMLLTLASLVGGLFTMLRGAKASAYSNAFMRARVVLQAATLCVFVIVLLYFRN